MRINIQTKNLDLSDAIRAYVEDKVQNFSKLLSEELDPLLEIELAKERPDQNNGEELFKAEINLLFRGEQIYLDALASDLYAAIDELKDKVMRELRQSKEKTEALAREGAREAKAILRGE